MVLLIPILSKISYSGINPAYIGPGTGLTAIGAFLAVAAGIAIAVFGFFWYPIKRLLGKNKESAEPKPEIDEEE